MLVEITGADFFVTVMTLFLEVKVTGKVKNYLKLACLYELVEITGKDFFLKVMG